MVLLPKPVESIETEEESSDTVLSSLDGTSQKKNNLDNFFILGNPVIEWLSKLFWLIFLIPVLNVLGRFQNVGSSSVNGRLDFSKSWLKGAVSFTASSSLKMDIDLEEWLQDLLWHVSSSADSFFHLIERIFGSVEKSLIHGPIVVLGKLLDFLSRDWLNMLIKLVRADGLDKILNSSFNFVVLGLKLLRFFSDPFRLHLYELIKSEGLSILWKVDQNSL